MAGSRNHAPLEQLLDEIKFQRRKELRSFCQDPGFTIAHNTTYWTDLFVRHFLFQADTAIDSDDLLFFVRKRQVVSSTQFLSPRYESEVEVFRRDSRKLPIGDPDVDWEETIYLNLIIHLFDYKITLAICSRTSPTDLQVLRRSTQEVWASPSHRRMDSKSECEEMTYPFVCFTVDNFDEAFSDIQVRDGEMVAVELVARDTRGSLEAVLSLGCIQYDSTRRVYDARTSQSVGQRLSQTNLLSMFGNTRERVEYVHMKGLGDKGHVELAISKPKGAGCETPTSEPGFSITDQCLSDYEDELEEQNSLKFQKGHQRRLSDPSSSIDTWLRSGWKSKPNHSRSTSESDGLEKWLSPALEIEAGDLRDHLDDGATNPLWAMRGYTQVFHGWKENKRAGCIPLKVHLTYLTLPWWHIVKDILETRETSMLTF